MTLPSLPLQSTDPTMLTKPNAPSPQTLSTLFTSLSRPSRPWLLTRRLRSDNPAEINGELKGTATFTSQKQGGGGARDMLYREEGEMPGTVVRGMAGLRWSKKYIWRLEEAGAVGISVWFVKVGGEGAGVKSSPAGSDVTRKEEPEDEADYLFHEFEFVGSGTDDDATSLDPSTNTTSQQGTDTNAETSPTFISPPVPPLPSPSTPTATTTVLTARGNHLCINDMYRTAYSFRIRPETGEVLSWASRHVVKGPKKNQDIVNLYEMDAGVEG